MRISDWSSDVCSSDLAGAYLRDARRAASRSGGPVRPGSGQGTDGQGAVTLDLAGCSDGELAALALAGRQSAYGELMRRHREPVYRLVRGHIGDADAALDVTQQSFIAAFAALARYDGARPFRVWMARIAINKCHDWTRRRAVRRLFSFAADRRGK